MSQSRSYALGALSLFALACDLSYLGPPCATCMDASDEPTADAPNEDAPVDAGADASGYAQAIAQAAPIAWYRFEEPASSIQLVDSSGHGHDGTYTTGVTLQAPGVAGSHAAQFDGTSFAVVPRDDAGVLDFAGKVPFSVEFWMNTSTYQDTETPVTKDDDDGGGGWTSFTYVFTGKITVQREHTSSSYEQAQTNVAPPLNQWAYVAFTYDGGTLSVFLNGQLSGQSSSILALPTLKVDVTIAQSFTGYLDELALYDRALTSAEILAHYNLGK